MFNELKGKIRARCLTIEKVAELLGVAVSTFARKLNGETEFTRSEILTLKKTLNLNDDEFMSIFFREE